MTPTPLTIIAPIVPDRVSDLVTLLQVIGDDIRGQSLIPFQRLTTTHFCRWVVLPGTSQYEPQLVFESNYDDGTLDGYLDHLLLEMPAGLDRIYSHCEGWSGPDPQSARRYLSRLSVPCAAHHVAYAVHSLRAIRSNSGFRTLLEDLTDQERSAGRVHRHTPPRALRSTLLQGARARDPSSSAASIGMTSAAKSIRKYLFFFALSCSVLVLLPLLAIWIVAIAIEERREQDAPAKPVNAASELLGKENFAVQNQLTHVVEVKPGFLRLYTLKAVLFSIDAFARFAFTSGRLGTIDSIHCAQWVLIDGGRRLLFMSNFDGSWENYLDDFIDRASIGLTAVWSNTKHFPRTSFLFFGGARDEERFKAWARENQVHTQLWFSHHPDETVTNIINNIELRAATNSDLDDAAALRWLQRL
jgi:hypothetical protein